MAVGISWLNPKRKELVRTTRRIGEESWGKKFKADIAPSLARGGWSPGAISRYSGDKMEKWGQRLDEAGLEMGSEQIGEEYKTSERIGSETHGVKMQKISDVNAMNRLRTDIEARERMAAEDRAMTASLASSNRRFSRRMGYLSAATGLIGAGAGAYGAFKGAQYAANLAK